ncbi:MAG: VacJ family lipoprotein [Lautropia mirabilis]|nr:VacJ family lipoprotein [Lautropia mirabilis]
MTGETRPDGMMAPVHLRLAGVALALSLAGCASVSGTNGGDAAGTGAATGKEAASSAASASAAQSASGNVATAAAGDAAASTAGGAATSAAGDAAASTAGDAATDAATSAAGDALKAAGVPTDLSVDNVTGGVKLSHLTTYDPKDPLQAYNRVMFAFNERADQYALKPVAKAYRFITPKPVQFVVGNFFSNLGDLWTGFNHLLQGKGKAAASDTARFFVNSTLGFLGFADVATEMGLEKHNEDLGQTLGWWGVPSGPYFVIPLLGPSTIRDATSRLVDAYGQPYMWQDGHEALKWSLWTVDKVHTRASLLDAEGALNDAALDKYTLMRDGWLARRRNQVYDGDPPDEDDAADPYGDDPYTDDPYADDPTQDESDSGAAGDASAQSAADKASDAAANVSDKASEAADKVKEITKKKAGKAAGGGS